MRLNKQGHIVIVIGRGGKHQKHVRDQCYTSTSTVASIKAPVACEQSTTSHWNGAGRPIYCLYSTSTFISLPSTVFLRMSKQARIEASAMNSALSANSAPTQTLGPKSKTKFRGSFAWLSSADRSAKR